MYEKIEDDALLAAWFFARAQKLFQAHLRVWKEFALRRSSRALTSPRQHSQEQLLE